MNDQERLQLIIKTALKHGWGEPTIEIQDEILNRWSVDSSLRLHVCEDIINLSDILYGDNLSLLKAACGDEFIELDGVRLTKTGRKESLLGDVSIWGEGVYGEIDGPKYRLIALQSVLLPDAERLAFICDHLRKD